MSGDSPSPAARVRRTGIALVHAGELVLPAAGSEAQAAAVAQADRTDVHFHFPVEIHVVDLGGGIDRDELADHTLQRLLSGLHGEQG